MMRVVDKTGNAWRRVEITGRLRFRENKAVENLFNQPVQGKSSVLIPPPYYPVTPPTLKTMHETTFNLLFHTIHPVDSTSQHAKTCFFPPFLHDSHLPESHRGLQVCWCSSGPGWRTRRRGPRGCCPLPCSPCSHRSRPWRWRRS